ncbi:hypothetical protein N0V86_005997 [Didymella sp. IMI 355093]|nr:hypothetical protein N0V86_005997 [Didymella sp. IMI 355093]
MASTLGKAPDFQWYHCQLNEYNKDTTLTYNNWLGWNFSISLASHFKVIAKPDIPQKPVPESIVIRLPLLRKGDNVPRTTDNVCIDLRGVPGDKYIIVCSALIESQAAGLELIVEFVIAHETAQTTVQGPTVWKWAYSIDHEPLMADTQARVTNMLLFPYLPFMAIAPHGGMPTPPYPGESPMRELLMQFPEMKIEESAPDIYCVQEEQQGKTMWRLTTDKLPSNISSTMAPTIHVIDPDADTIVILRNACTQFAAWDEPVAVEPSICDIPAVDPFAGLSKVQRKKLERRLAAKMALTQDEDPNAPTHLGGHSQKPPIPEPQKKPEPEVHYNVSSRHLQLASPWFKRAMAKEGWAEAKLVDGRYQIFAHDWDEEAFLIVLNVFHLRNRKISRTVSLEMLAKVAVLVDYYECGEALEWFTSVWIEEFNNTVTPFFYCRDLILWIWVAWVFDLPERFTDATKVAIRESKDAMGTLDLPIPPSVSSEIDLRRYQAIEAVIDGLHNLLDKYRSSDYQCKSDSALSFQCSSFLLGAFTKELENWSLINPRPEIPFANSSFSSICAKSRTAKSPAWAAVSNAGYYQSSIRLHPCNLTSEVLDVVNKAEDGILGLSLCRMRGDKSASAQKPTEQTTKQSFHFDT